MIDVANLPKVSNMLIGRIFQFSIPVAKSWELDSDTS